MTIYVETNFPLEITFQQEQAASCESLLQLADAGRVRLIVPAFSLTEAYGPVVRRGAGWKKFAEQTQTALDPLRRTLSYADLRAEAQRIADLLSQISQEADGRLRTTQDRLLRCGILIPQTATIIEAAFDCEARFGLTRPDAVVLASVLAHLGQAPAGPKLFLNRDGGFNDATVRQELNRYECELIRSFEAGVSRVESWRR